MDKIAILQAQLAQIERPAKTAARRQDTHEKILLGGLVVKAGLRHADPSYLLGVLLEAAEKMNDGAHRARMIDRGRKGFKE